MNRSVVILIIVLFVFSPNLTSLVFAGDPPSSSGGSSTTAGGKETSSNGAVNTGNVTVEVTYIDDAGNVYTVKLKPGERIKLPKLMKVKVKAAPSPEESWLLNYIRYMMGLNIWINPRIDLYGKGSPLFWPVTPGSPWPPKVEPDSEWEGPPGGESVLPDLAPFRARDAIVPLADKPHDENKTTDN